MKTPVYVNEQNNKTRIYDIDFDLEPIIVFKPKGDPQEYYFSLNEVMSKLLKKVYETREEGSIEFRPEDLNKNQKHFFNIIYDNENGVTICVKHKKKYIYFPLDDLLAQTFEVTKKVTDNYYGR